VSIFDATNSTAARRNFLRDRLHGRLQYMFLEIIVNDQALLERNYRAKMRFSPDYKGVGMEAALADFTVSARRWGSLKQTLKP
jgi:6-phosphofructo-2-kinase/fructose-2,6-biphosphatase